MKRQAWGKTERGIDSHSLTSTHPLAHHCMDVAAVFGRMLQLPIVRKRLETAAKTSLTEVMCERLCVLAFLHDIGKLHPGFQAKGWPEDLWCGQKCGHLKEGWEFLFLAWQKQDHPFHNTIQQIECWGDAARELLSAMFAHHGHRVCVPSDPTEACWKCLKHYDWREEASRMNTALRNWFPYAFVSESQKLPDTPRFHHAVAGFAALADWIGSDRRFFDFSAPFDLAYPENKRVHEIAERALREIGFDSQALARLPAPGFTELTGFAAPNAVQAEVGKLGAEARLVVLEAETGSGKTEAALWHFARLLSAGRVSGLYFAVPTRSAARQLHRRIDSVLRRVFGSEMPDTVLAIPGIIQAGEYEAKRLPDWNVLWEDQSEAVPARWAAEHSTRFLAAPLAVGTIDQAMLASLQVKHAHLRGSALSRSLLVIDEVHASDAYMTEVLGHLLKNHLAIGGYAMLMSATLGSRARTSLIEGTAAQCPSGDPQAFPSFEEASEAPYPAVWVQGEAKAHRVADLGRTRNVHMDTVTTMDAQTTAELSIQAAEQGALVLVIRNTVKCAMDTWHAIREMGKESLLLQVNGGPALHHSRFFAEDRISIDKAVETALSPNRMANALDREANGLGCIVVGTQTLEQSLDIDADMLITDLCPMDVLLQRIGRLHRHELSRPMSCKTAQTIVLLPEKGLDRLTKPLFENGLGAWQERAGGLNGIYTDLASLELTRQLILEHSVWQIPQMNRMLVEGSTHPDRTGALISEKGDDWNQYDRKHGGTEAAREMIARQVVLDREQCFGEAGSWSSKSDERIMTRLGEEGALIRIDPDSAPIGPFGQKVSRIALPSHWSCGVTAQDAEEATLEPAGDDFLLSVAGRSFRYSRVGLVQEDC